MSAKQYWVRELPKQKKPQSVTFKRISRREWLQLAKTEWIQARTAKVNLV